VTVFAVSSAMVAYNALLCYGYTDFNGVFWNPILYHNLAELRLPILPFTLLVPSLSLLLVFRTNASYGRWAEARQQWSLMETECRNVMRMTAAWSSPNRESNIERRAEQIGEVGDVCYVFMRSLLRHVSGPPDEKAFRADIRATSLPEKEAEAIINAGNRHFRSLYYLSRTIEALPMSERQRIEVDKACVIIGDTAGGTERVYGTPVPTSYSRQASRFLTSWLFLLPFGLYDAFDFTWNHVGLIPASVTLSAFLCIIEELSVQLEEPFSVLALPSIVQDIQVFANQLPQWHAMYTNEEYNLKFYGGEEAKSPVSEGNEDQTFAFKWTRTHATPTPNPEKMELTPDEFDYCPSFEDFIPIRSSMDPSFMFFSDKITAKQLNDLTVGEVNVLHAEMGNLKQMVRGSGHELQTIKKRVEILDDRATKLNSRGSSSIHTHASGTTHSALSIAVISSDVEGKEVAEEISSTTSTNAHGKSLEKVAETDSILAKRGQFDDSTSKSESNAIVQNSTNEVQALKNQVAVKNSEISSINQRVRSLHSRASDLLERCRSSSKAKEDTEMDIVDFIAQNRQRMEAKTIDATIIASDCTGDGDSPAEPKSESGAMVQNSAYEVKALKDKVVVKNTEISSIRGRVQSLHSQANDLLERSKSSSKVKENAEMDIEEFIAQNRQKLEAKVIDATIIPSSVSTSTASEHDVMKGQSLSAEEIAAMKQLDAMVDDIILMKDQVQSQALDLDQIKMRIVTQDRKAAELQAKSREISMSDVKSNIEEFIEGLRVEKSTAEAMKHLETMVVDVQTMTKQLKEHTLDVNEIRNMTQNLEESAYNEALNHLSMLSSDVQAISEQMKLQDSKLENLRQGVEAQNKKASSLKEQVPVTASTAIEQHIDEFIEELQEQRRITEAIQLVNLMSTNTTALSKQMILKNSELENIRQRIETQIEKANAMIEQARNGLLPDANKNIAEFIEDLKAGKGSRETFKHLEMMSTDIQGIVKEMLTQGSELSEIRQRLEVQVKKANSLKEKALEKVWPSTEQHIDDFVADLQSEYHMKTSMKLVKSMSADIQEILQQMLIQDSKIGDIHQRIESQKKKAHMLMERTQSNVSSPPEENIEDFITNLKAQREAAKGLELVNAISADIEDLAKQMLSQDSKIGDIRQRMESQKEKTHKLIKQARDAAPSSSVENIENFLTSLNAPREVTETPVPVNSMSADIKELAKQMSSQGSELGDIRQRIESQGDIVRSLKERAQDAVSASVGQHIGDFIDDLKAQREIDKAIEIVNSMSSDVKALSKRMLSQGSDIGDIRKRVETQKRKANSLMKRAKDAISSSPKENIENFIEDMRIEKSARESLKQLEMMSTDVQAIVKEMLVHGGEIGDIRQRMDLQKKAVKCLKEKALDAKGLSGEQDINDFIEDLKANDSATKTLDAVNSMSADIHSMTIQMQNQVSEIAEIRQRVESQDKRAQSLMVRSKASGLEFSESDVNGFIEQIEEQDNTNDSLNHLREMAKEIQSMIEQVRLQDSDLGVIKERIMSQKVKAVDLHTRSQESSDKDISDFIAEHKTQSESTDQLRSMASNLEHVMTNMHTQDSKIDGMRNKLTSVGSRLKKMKGRSDSGSSTSPDTNMFDFINDLRTRVHSTKETSVNNSSEVVTPVEVKHSNKVTTAAVVLSTDLLTSPVAHKNGKKDPLKAAIEQNETSSNGKVLTMAAEVRLIKERIRSKTSHLTDARKILDKLSDKSRELNSRR